MKKFLIIVFCSLFICFAVVRLWAGPILQFAYRITFTFATPHGPIRGSTVIVTAIPGGRPIVTSGGPKIWGDAIFLNTALGKPIVILTPSTELPRVAFNISLSSEEVRLGETVDQKVARLPIGAKAVVPFDILPEIVTFNDANDPSSARVLFYNRPHKIINNFMNIFGDGWDFDQATIEIICVISGPAYVLGPFWPQDWHFVSEPLYANNINSKISWLYSQQSIEFFDRALAVQIGTGGPGIGLGRSHFYQQGF